MPNRQEPNQADARTSRDDGPHESQHEPDNDANEPAEPLNRAERRALRKGKKQGAPPAGARVVPPSHHEPGLVPRRSGRRGNR